MTEQEVKIISNLEILDGICNHLFEKDFMFITREEQVDIMNAPLKELIEAINIKNSIKSINEARGFKY